jgi:uroporphyrinogen-III synthase
VVVASGNAVAGVPAAFHALPLLAVGDATAALARQAGFVCVHSAGADAAALAALAARHCDTKGAPLLLATGARQGTALAADLRQRGFRVLRRIVYMACPVTALPPAALQAVRDGTLHAALFFSAETAAAFVRAVPPDLLSAFADIEALAISQRVGHVLRPLPWRRVRVAVRPTQDDLLALLHE